MINRRKFFEHSAGGLGALMLPFATSAGKAPMPNAAVTRALRIAHITDVHILDQKNATTCFARVVNEINTMKDKPDLIINTGDSVMDENAETRETVQRHWTIWTDQISGNKIPMMSAIGNHDVWYGPDSITDADYKKDKRYGKQWAIEMLSLPNRFYSFDRKGWRFIALDSINGDSGYQLDEG